MSRYCSICGYEATIGSRYCEKHDDYSNHPSSPVSKFCTGCGDRMKLDDDNDECEVCQRKRETIRREMNELADEYKSRRPGEAPKWEWADCPKCGHYTIHVQAYRRTNSTLDIITFGATSISYEIDEMRCTNCGYYHKI